MSVVPQQAFRSWPIRIKWGLKETGAERAVGLQTQYARVRILFYFLINVNYAKLLWQSPRTEI